MQKVERDLVRALVDVLREMGDEPGEISRLDVLDDLAVVGARVLAAQHVADDFDPVQELAAALNNIPASGFDTVDAGATAVARALDEAALTLVVDVFDDASGDYFKQFD